MVCTDTAFTALVANLISKQHHQPRATLRTDTYAFIPCCTALLPWLYTWLYYSFNIWLQTDVVELLCHAPRLHVHEVR